MRSFLSLSSVLNVAGVGVVLSVSIRLFVYTLVALALSMVPLATGWAALDSLGAGMASADKTFRLRRGKPLHASRFSPRPAHTLKRVDQLLEEQRYTAAERLARRALRAQKGRAERGRLRWVAGDAAEKAGDTKRATHHFFSLSRMSHPLAPYAKLRFAALAAEKQPGRAKRAVVTLAQEDWPGRAEARKLLARVDRAGVQKAEVRSPTSSEEKLQAAHRLYQSGQYAQSEVAFARLVLEFSGDKAKQCEARLMQGKSLSRQRAYDRATGFMQAVARECPDSQTKAEARYHAAKAFTRKKEYEPAIKEYDALVREAASTTLADDAMFLSALLCKEIGDTSSMKSRFAELIRRFPDGDMHGEARFLLALEARAEGNHARAFEVLDAAIAAGLQEDADGEAGRAAYFRARSLADLGREEEALEAYLAVCKRYPLSYYAQQAVARLRAMPEASLNEVISHYGRLSDKTPSLSFAWRKTYGSREFRRALELLAVRDSERALKEFSALGLMSEHQPMGGRWLVASLFYAAGQVPQASRVMRASRGYRSEPPTGDFRSAWLLAYPPAYSKWVKRYAKGTKVPETLVYAVAREESAFQPTAVSPAKAYGLMQIIMPTAQSVAKPLGLRATREALMRPAFNIRLGVSYIDALVTRYEKNPAVVPASYNAGPTAVDRWLRARPSEDLDAWIEFIPYKETRRYTRRVLQSFGIYSYLYEGELLSLDAALPVLELRSS